jgi:magnesium chelatase subunit I
MPQSISELPRTLGELRNSAFPEERLARRTVKDELRANLICKLQRREELFPGIVGYEDSVVPQVVNAILSRHNFILLGLRGQAKTRLIRTPCSIRGCHMSPDVRSTTTPTPRSAAAANCCWLKTVMRRRSPG